MIIHEAIGNIRQNQIEDKIIDFLDLEWYETFRRIQRKKTRAGKDIAIKFLKEKQRILDGDILFIDNELAIVVNVLPTKSIILTPQSTIEMSAVCHDIGNKHLPLYFQDEILLMPFELTIYNWLKSNGFNPIVKEEKLLNLLNANVDHHKESKIGTSLSTKGLKIKLSKED
ncbi:urease accessory protein UreE [Chishuiella sp.]|uniref:urease accessory protein UreE n=1 Tax=Chishuiella sp. TaxID=1969467 RepID=UPI0028A8D0E4|nr:urease accessory protein UreE [Chishuiella sp.]